MGGVIIHSVFAQTVTTPYMPYYHFTADCTRISDQTVRQIKQCPSRKLVGGPLLVGGPRPGAHGPSPVDRSMPGKNCHLFLSRFSQWIQLPETILFEISFWATLKYSSNPIWRPKSKMAARLPRTVTFWASLC